MAFIRVEPRGNLGFTDEENLRWAWLRAVEWAAFPAFISQPVLPILYLYLPVWQVVIAVLCASAPWALIRYKFVSPGLANAGCLLVRLKWVTVPVCAIIAISKHRYLVAAAIALAPLYAGFLGIPGKIGILQRQFMHRLGYLYSDDLVRCVGNSLAEARTPLASPPLYTDENHIQRVILNPRLPVSPYICLGCWNILDDITAYCRKCGRVGSCFGYRQPSGEHCFQHPSTPASEFCNYCGRPFCSACLETDKGSILSMGTYSFHCLLCLEDIKRLRGQAREENPSRCRRHPDCEAQYRCAECNEPTCKFCTYHAVTGLFRKRAAATGYCFSCIRGMVWERKIRRCIVSNFVGGEDFEAYMF
jgi:hypothetical protein